MKRLPDSFIFGLLFGVLSLGLTYFLVRSIRLAVVNYYGNHYMLAPPRIQLITIMLNILFFRFIMVNLKKENAGKGMLFSTVILSLIYFWLFLRYNFTFS
jgi:hypothetical protein